MTSRDIRVPGLMNADEYLAYSEECALAGTTRSAQLRKMANRWTQYQRNQRQRESAQHAQVMPMFLPSRSQYGANIGARMRV